MINNISDSTVRTVVKNDAAEIINNKEITQQKASAIRQVRPVEKAESGAKANVKKAREQEDSSKYLLEDKTMVFERYNQKGDLVYRVPPAHKPVDERV